MQQLLDRQAVAQVVRHRAQVIHAVGQRNHLLVKLGLARLLDARMQIANLGIQPYDNFAVDLQHQTQHSVRRRMLRSHVQDHVLVFGALGHRSFEDRRPHNIWHQR